MTKRAYFEISQGDQSGARAEIPDQGVLIGGSSDCDLVLTDPSAEDAELFASFSSDRDDSSTLLLKAKSGKWKRDDGSPFSEAEVANGQTVVLKIGKSVIRFCGTDNSAAESVESVPLLDEGSSQVPSSKLTFGTIWRFCTVRPWLTGSSVAILLFGVGAMTALFGRGGKLSPESISLRKADLPNDQKPQQFDVRTFANHHDLEVRQNDYGITLLGRCATERDFDILRKEASRSVDGITWTILVLNTAKENAMLLLKGTAMSLDFHPEPSRTASLVGVAPSRKSIDDTVTRLKASIIGLESIDIQAIGLKELATRVQHELLSKNISSFISITASDTQMIVRGTIPAGLWEAATTAIQNSLSEVSLVPVDFSGVNVTEDSQFFDNLLPSKVCSISFPDRATSRGMITTASGQNICEGSVLPSGYTVTIIRSRRCRIQTPLGEEIDFIWTPDGRSCRASPAAPAGNSGST